MSGEVIRHQCQSHGCFLDKHVLKFNIFCDIFPRGINFTDIDGMVEYGGKFLLMEWKRDLSCITKGQTICALAWTQHDKFVWIDVLGDAADMSCSHFRLWYDGKVGEWLTGDINDLKQVIAKWRDMIDAK